MTWISPDVPQMTEEEAKALLIGVGHRQPVKIEGGKLLAWYSICSRHFWHDPECELCKAGSWQEYQEDDRHKGL